MQQKLWANHFYVIKGNKGSLFEDVVNEEINALKKSIHSLTMTVLKQNEEIDSIRTLNLKTKR